MEAQSQHPGFVDAWRGLRDTPYDLYRIHYTADTIGKPICDPQSQIQVAFDRLLGMVVFGFHDRGSLSEVWEITNLICGELRETLAMPGFPVKPLIVSSSLAAYSRAASFLPPLAFVGANERVSMGTIDGVLYERDVIPHPFVLDRLSDAYALVEPFAPIGKVRSDDQSSRYTLIAMET